LSDIIQLTRAIESISSDLTESQARPVQSKRQRAYGALISSFRWFRLTPNFPVHPRLMIQYAGVVGTKKDQQLAFPDVVRLVAVNSVLLASSLE
jgi:hypothetical protein